MGGIEYRERLYAVLSDSEVSVESRIDDALDIGVDYLGLPIGFFTRIEDDTQTVVRATGEHDLIQPGETCPLDDAYCRRTVELESPLAIQDAVGSSSVSGSAVETFGLGAYIGARVVVKGETYGTVCFADTETRPGGFSDAESYFVELAARLVGQILEQQSYERELDDREAEIDTQEEVYRAVVDASFDLVFQIDPGGQITYVSDTVTDLLGYSASECIGQSCAFVLPDRETRGYAAEIYEAVMAGDTVVREFFPLEHENGESVLVDVRVTPLYSGTVSPAERTPDDIVGLQGIARDARDRHRRQRMIQVLNRVLRHNLRNDMTVIRGYAEMLYETLDAEGATQARKIVDKSDQLLALSETARQFETTLEAPPKITTADVVPVVSRAAARIDDEYPGATITVQTPETATARSSPSLETAITELLDNAAKHAGERPSITVTVLVDDSTTVRIEDDGPGLPNNERAVLSSGDETPLEHGGGLGLWLTYCIVESLGGRLTVPEHDDGTCIEVTLRRPDDAKGR
ncbi:PAS domain S-box protein [Halapricum sp. CBA1109]|uniref:ATP-binding protein n=1 Tax=Halapricum sp. CBA1109 TaxID=2668068 RepID=UPI0012FA7715|nr:ATP-binding protein [Halapricum sp. CBA1109]MUV88506.1 PAS domain S-box protein [Halapricum sp. CBA1109]